VLFFIAITDSDSAARTYLHCLGQLHLYLSQLHCSGFQGLSGELYLLSACGGREAEGREFEEEGRRGIAAQEGTRDGG
jgi:hypothetical protein